MILKSFVECKCFLCLFITFTYLIFRNTKWTHTSNWFQGLFLQSIEDTFVKTICFFIVAWGSLEIQYFVEAMVNIYLVCVIQRDVIKVGCCCRFYTKCTNTLAFALTKSFISYIPSFRFYLVVRMYNIDPGIFFQVG